MGATAVADFSLISTGSRWKSTADGGEGHATQNRFLANNVDPETAAIPLTWQLLTVQLPL